MAVYKCHALYTDPDSKVVEVSPLYASCEQAFAATVDSMLGVAKKLEKSGFARTDDWNIERYATTRFALECPKLDVYLYAWRWTIGPEALRVFTRVAQQLGLITRDATFEQIRAAWKVHAGKWLGLTPEAIHGAPKLDTLLAGMLKRRTKSRWADCTVLRVSDSLRHNDVTNMELDRFLVKPASKVGR